MTGWDERIRIRLTVVAVIVLSLFGLLIARLWFLQVLAGERFAQASERNRVRLVSVEAPRGRILDREGRVLVKNRTALAIGIRKDDLPRDPKQARAVKKRVADLLGITVKDVDRKLADRRTSPYKPVVIEEDVPETAVFTVMERREEFPGVEALTLPVRTYPHGRLGAHILGYVGETTEGELATLKGYRLGDTIGRTGMERTYERWLRGAPGLQKLEVDATGRVLRELGNRPTVPGSDLQLTIDLDVQKVAERALAEGIERARQQTFRETGERFRAPAGAAVVLDARTGEVVAMASHPTFDLRRFVGGVGEDYWRFLNDEDNHYPLLNRAIQSAYPPGSTYKPVVAAAALETGMGAPGGRYPCLSVFRFGDRGFRNWRPRNARISIEQSLIESCDTVYYQFAANWWRADQERVAAGREAQEVMQDWSRRFGLGEPTGIDLPQEASGRIPDRAWRRRVWEANRTSYCETYRRTKEALFGDLCERGFLWRGGDSINMSIGQGDVTTTPLQMATVYAAVANGGKVVQPRLAMRVLSPEGDAIRTFKSKVRKRVKADAFTWRYLRTALRKVPEEGTAAFPYRGWPFDEIPVAAKTGSAEIAGKQPFSWFASFAPADDPQYVAIAVVEEGGFGSQVAGPVVRRIMDELFDQPPLPIVYGTTRSD